MNIFSSRLVIAALLSAFVLSPSGAQFASQVVNSVSVGGITGLGTNVATALGIAVGSAGGPVTNGGALGTPSSGTATNLSGTAASLTAGTVTTNANSTGDVTSSGNATTIAANAVTNAKAAQMANSTIKCRTTAGTGNSEDCTATQAATIIAGATIGTLKSKRIEITRDLTVASGNVAYTGVGFIPSTCTGFGDAGTSLSQYVTVIGVVDSAASAANMSLVTAGVVYDGAAFLRFFDATGASSQRASLNSYDADGFTLAWTKTGTPTGTATITIICYR